MDGPRQTLDTSANSPCEITTSGNLMDGEAWLGTEMEGLLTHICIFHIFFCFVSFISKVSFSYNAVITLI